MLKTLTPPLFVAPALRSLILNMDGNLPVYNVATMSDLVSQSVAQRRFQILLVGAFSSLAALLAVVVIYGVVSYFVARRTREMGIRLALGAEPARVRALVQRGAMSTVLLGILAGVAGSIAIMRLMESLLYEVSPYDPMTLTGVVALLLGAAWLASYLPARRTSRIDPIGTMRAE